MQETDSAYSGFAELRAIEESLRRYNADIVRNLSGCLEGRKRVLDFGAGIGTLAMEWEKQTGVKPDCLEVDARQRQMILERGFRCYAAIDSASKTFEAIYSSNVLEHIEDDLGAFVSMYSLLEEGGVLALYVPAFMCLFSELDRSAGHYRRYGRAELIHKTMRAGFRVVKCEYSDCLGFAAWLANGATFPGAAALRLYDRWIYPVSRVLDGVGMRRVAGKNLILIAKK